MRKKYIMLFAVISVAFLLVFLASCGEHTYQEALTTTEEDTSCFGGYFTEITEWWDDSGTYYIVYANDTKVKYLICRGLRSVGVTPLYNADGTLQIYVPEG